MNGYPLKFQPIYKDKIWGGNKLKSFLNKDYGSLPNCGETWEISAVKGNVSTVTNGTLAGRSLDGILNENPEAWMGQSVVDRFGKEFPLLIKFLDAAQDLSVQVHPDDAMAEKRHQGKGKTEMWYILQADEGATLIDGFNRTLNKEEYLHALQNGQIMNVLNKVPVSAGDVFYIPAGRVHTIGKGIVLAEIQQTSDITYRIYDFDRVDDQGKPRDLHTELALDALDFKYVAEVKTQYHDRVNQVVNLVESPFFTTNKLAYTSSVAHDISAIDSFKIYICLDGEFSIRQGEISTSLSKGECALVPASWKKYHLETSAGFQALETYIQSH